MIVLIIIIIIIHFIYNALYILAISKCYRVKIGKNVFNIKQKKKVRNKGT